MEKVSFTDSSGRKRSKYRDLDELHPVPESVCSPSVDTSNSASGIGVGYESESMLLMSPSSRTKRWQAASQNLAFKDRGGNSASLKKKYPKSTSQSIYAKVDTSDMVRNTSKFDLGAMQLSGMTHSVSTLNFLQDALDNEVSEKFLKRIPSWKHLQNHTTEDNHNTPETLDTNALSSSETSPLKSEAAIRDASMALVGSEHHRTEDNSGGVKHAERMSGARDSSDNIFANVSDTATRTAENSKVSLLKSTQLKVNSSQPQLQGSSTTNAGQANRSFFLKRGKSAPSASSTRWNELSFGSASSSKISEGTPDSDTIPNISKPSPLRLGAILKPLRNGVDVIVDDSFWRCFEDRESLPWNWNFYLFPMWLVGTLIRYLILFPLRLLMLLLGFLICGAGFVFVQMWYGIGCSCRSCGHKNRLSAESSFIRIFASSFVVSWTGVVRYHGIRPSDTMQKRVFVANHSSMIDVAIVLQRDNYSLVGQQHKGWIAVIQNKILASLHCVWFQRGEARDRNAVFRKLQKHARNESGNLPPLLVFPEGTCVNTDHIIQFKKGVFTLDRDIAICPIALKYNPLLVDAYWNSRRYSFLRHLFHLMTAWALVCDVYYLEPQYRGENETPVEFAKRVQHMIAQQANLISRDWDGYMKYWQPSARFKRAQQLAFARDVLPDLIPQTTPGKHNLNQASQATQMLDTDKLRRRR